MLKNLAFLVVLALEMAAWQIAVFPQYGLFGSGAVFMQALLFFALVLSLPRPLASAVILLESLLLFFLYVYHGYFADSLSFSVVWEQAREGGDFLLKSPLSFLNKGSVVFLGVLVLKLFYLIKYYAPWPHFRNQIRLIAVFPLIVLAVLDYQNFGRQQFFQRDFNRYSGQLGYVHAWAYELATETDGKILKDKVIRLSRLPLPALPPELRKIKPSGHVWIIQVESLDYDAVAKQISGRPVMPFLSGMVRRGVAYRLTAHIKKSSANSDFSILTGIPVYDETYAAAYNILPENIYGQLPTLPALMKAKGYRTAFYHGFKSWFYNRKKHMQAMGFDNVWFDENIPAPYPRSGWGVDDKELFGFAASQLPEKAFSFLITVSSHEDYEIGRASTGIYVAPRTEKERYLNALNYVDGALKNLVEKAPEDSLFILYSDHHSGVSESNDTLFLVYDKRGLPAYEGNLKFQFVPLYIKALLSSF